MSQRKVIEVSIFNPGERGQEVKHLVSESVVTSCHSHHP